MNTSRQELTTKLSVGITFRKNSGNGFPLISVNQENQVRDQDYDIDESGVHKSSIRVTEVDRSEVAITSEADIVPGMYNQNEFLNA